MIFMFVLLISMIKKIVIYQGEEYNIAPFISQHPGGEAIIDHYLTLKKDITDVFKSMHSKEAQIKLLSLQKNVKADRVKSDRTYTKIEQRVRRYYSPSYFNQIVITLLIYGIFISKLFWGINPISILATTAITQVSAAWLCHSQLHLRNSFIHKLGRITGGLIMGLSADWWKRKHEKHHLFTNHDKLDEDIQHNYPVLLYPFMLVKWRIQSVLWLLRRFKRQNLIEIVTILIHYYFIVKQKIWLPFALGVLFAGLYLAVISQGNHEREKRYQGELLTDFLTEQTESTRNYDVDNWLLSWLMGGFNYHTQHHLFPQVPFYKLDKAHRIVLEEFAFYKKRIETGNIIV